MPENNKRIFAVLAIILLILRLFLVGNFMLISFEGIDFCGKSTQIAMLESYFRSSGRCFKTVREPGGNELSEKLRDILLNSKSEIDEVTEIFLFSAARSYLVKQVINKELANGNIIICDRFFDSTLAYQGYGRKGDVEAIKSINALAVGTTIPDITLFIDISLDTMRLRSGGMVHDRIESSGIEFYTRVRDGYRQIASDNPDRIITINGEESPEKVFAQIQKSIEKYEKR